MIDLNKLTLDIPQETELTIVEQHQVTELYRTRMKAWWIAVMLNIVVWLLFPFIGPKGGVPAVTHMTYAGALLQFIAIPIILIALIYYNSVYKFQKDVDSRKKIILITSVNKLSKLNNNNVTLLTINKKYKRFNVPKPTTEIDITKPVVVHFLKRTRVVLAYSQL